MTGCHCKVGISLSDILSYQSVQTEVPDWRQMLDGTRACTSLQVRNIIDREQCVDQRPVEMWAVLLQLLHDFRLDIILPLGFYNIDVFRYDR